MGDLEVRGLDSKATERMVAAWRLLAGETYDSGYPQQFLDSISDQLPGGPMENHGPRIRRGPGQDGGRLAALRAQTVNGNGPVTAFQ